MTALRAPSTADTLEDLPLGPPMRIRPGVMTQRWDDLAFISWVFDAGDVQPLLPPCLEVDTFDGAAWVSVIPFRLSVRLPGTPLVPFGSHASRRSTSAPMSGGRTGGGASGSSAWTRRSWAPSSLPGAPTGSPTYMWARTRLVGDGHRWRYTGSRRWPRAQAAWDLTVDEGSPMTEVDDRHRFLTARWRLYSPGPLALPARTIAVRATTVDHPPWPLRHARLAEGTESLLDAAGLRGARGGPVVAFAPGVAVRFSPPRPATRVTTVA